MDKGVDKEVDKEMGDKKEVDVIDVGGIFIQKFPPRCRWNKNVINR